MIWTARIVVMPFGQRRSVGACGPLSESMNDTSSLVSKYGIGSFAGGW